MRLSPKLSVLVVVFGAATTVHAQDSTGGNVWWWIIGGLLLVIAIGSAVWRFFGGRKRQSQEPPPREVGRSTPGGPHLDALQQEGQVEESTDSFMEDQEELPQPPAEPTESVSTDRSLVDLETELEALHEEFARLQAASTGEGIIPDPESRRVIKQIMALTDEIKQRTAEDNGSPEEPSAEIEKGTGTAKKSVEKSDLEEAAPEPGMDYMEEAPLPLEETEEEVLSFEDVPPVTDDEQETITFEDPEPPPPSPPAKPPAPPAPAPIPASPPAQQDSDTTPIDTRTAEFTAYYPREAAVDRKSGLYVYALPPDAEVRAQVAQDVEKYKTDLGGEVPRPKTAKQTANLPIGTRITVLPESDEIEFEPASITKRWRGQWTRFGFEFWPDADLVDETAFVRVSVQVEGIEIAHIKAAVEITEAADGDVEPEPMPDPEEATVSPADLPENPLLRHKLTAQQITPYQRIFISYSRRDSDVARSYKIAQQALGNDCFLDVDNLRSGENWQAGLARAIDEADVFQLFWSNHSAASKYCRYEWEYALDQRCGDVTCEGFIRPVYWQKPMPRVPDELRSMNFKFVPFATEPEEPEE